ncbi:lipoprotein [Phycicoccus ginsengisoli]
MDHPGARIVQPTRRVLTLAAAGAGVAALAACGASNGTAAPTNPSTSTAAGSSSAPSGPRVTANAGTIAPSHATESNPPGDIPDNQAYVSYTPPGVALTVKVPEGWARSSQGGVTSFSDKLNTIQIQITKATAAPSEATVRDQDLPHLRTTVPNYAKGKVAAVARHAGTGVLATYQGDSAPNPVTGKVVRDAFERYTFFHKGTRVDLTLSGPTNADNVDPWRIVTDSLRWQG